MLLCLSRAEPWGFTTIYIPSPYRLGISSPPRYLACLARFVLYNFDSRILLLDIENFLEVFEMTEAGCAVDSRDESSEYFFVMSY